VGIAGRRARLLATCLLVTTHALIAQPSRRIATIEGLRRFPGFYHLQDVAVRGRVANLPAGARLQTDEHDIRLLSTTPWPEGPADVRGTLLDVGRLEPGDVRLVGYARPESDGWPRPGEELVLAVAGVTPLPPGQAPTTISVAAVALEPWRFDGQSITLIGQFRGRNLFGDSAAAPRRGPWDFVLKRGEASLWVVGMRPRGKGFDLSVDARVDTSQWLEITGVVRRNEGLTVVEATHIAVARQPGGTEPRETPAAPPAPPPAVEVVFSMPTADEVDVPGTSPVRIQFSRNVNVDTLTGRIRVAYVSTAPATMPPVPGWDLHYDSAARAAELRFRAPLEPFRTVRIEVAEGVLGFDGAPVLPWTLTFRVGR